MLTSSHVNKTTGFISRLAEANIFLKYKPLFETAFPRAY